MTEVLPDGFSLRPPILDDAEGIAELMNAHMYHLVNRTDYTPASVKSMLSEPSIDMNRDIRLIVNNEQKVIAYLAIWNHPPYVNSDFQVAISPDVEDQLYRQVLMEWGENLAQENLKRAPEDALVAMMYWCQSTDTSAIADLEARGYQHIRSNYRMSIDLAQEIPEPIWPENIVVKPFPEINDLRQVYRATDEIFRDHWGYVEQDEEIGFQDFKNWTESYEHIDPTYWYLAMDGDEIAGVSLCFPTVVGDNTEGHVDMLGVKASYRRQGIALALLYHSFRELQKLGRHKVTLVVDATNLSGATRLYKRAGMEIIEQGMSWEKILREGQDLRTQKLD